MTAVASGRVAPFGHLGITACVPLPRAYRSLPRPSSPPCAQASPTCLRSLDYQRPSSRATRGHSMIRKRPTICNPLPSSSHDDHAGKSRQRATLGSMKIHIPRSTSAFTFQTAAAIDIPQKFRGQESKRIQPEHGFQGTTTPSPATAHPGGREQYPDRPSTSTPVISRHGHGHGFS